MGAWNQAQGSENIVMLADGNGDFAEAIGLTWTEASSAWASAASVTRVVVNDGVVEQLNVEAPGESPPRGGNALGQR